jgi:DNA invertase Pin-like site-specific DNA recombinase
VYKVDRLTRALSDFAKLVDIFDRRGVSRTFQKDA